MPEPADIQWGMHTDSKQMGNCSYHQCFPIWNLWKDCKQIRNCRLNHHEFPVWNLATESRAGVNQSNGKLSAFPAAASVELMNPDKWGTGWKTNQIRSLTERAKLRTERHLPIVLGNSKKDSELKVRFARTMPMFLIVPQYHQKLASDSTVVNKSV